MEHYLNIPVFHQPLGISDEKNFFQVPDSWIIFISDVRGSTKAIENGRYKDVNIVGVSTISAVKNACGLEEIPYIFGGDGATFVLPADFDQSTQSALVGCAQMAKREFQFELRIRRIMVGALRRAGQDLKIGRFQISPNITMAVFMGGALSLADDWAKDPKREELKIDESQNVQASFEGLECRWQPIQSKRGEVLSLLLKARGQNRLAVGELYKNFLEYLGNLMGKSRHDLFPLSQMKMNSTFSLRKLLSEAKVRSLPKTLERIKYLLNLWLNSSVSYFLLKFQMKAFGVDWKIYKKEVIENSDFLKFDDTLRIVLDVDAGQKRQLLSHLEDLKNQGLCYYGAHLSKQALMTCLVENRFGKHVHFIDGAGGGYALAARQMKAQFHENPKA